MRRTTALLAALLLMVTAACGGDGDEDAPSGTDSPSAAGSDDGNGAGGGTGGRDDGAGDNGEPDGGDGASGSTAGEGENLSPEEQAARDRGAPGLPDASGRQTDVLTRVPGNARGTCEAVGSERDVRSGGFMAGPFDEVRRTWNTEREGFGRREVRLYFVPKNAKNMPGVVVTARSGGETVRVKQTNVADAEQWRYYEIRLKLPRPGEWTIRAAAGPDAGCFRVGL